MMKKTVQQGTAPEGNPDTHALNCGYPNTGREWTWQYVFPARNIYSLGIDERSPLNTWEMKGIKER